MSDASTPEPTETTVLQAMPVQRMNGELRHLFEHAKSAANSGNQAYAADLLLKLLVQVPTCDEARQHLLRALHGTPPRRIAPVSRFVAQLRIAVSIHVTGPKLLRTGQLERALVLSDKCLRIAPTSVAALWFMHRVCLRAGFRRTATEALEFCHLSHPEDPRTLRRLAEHYGDLDETAKVVAVVKKLCALRPDDLQLQTELKQAVATATIQRDKWDEAESFRDVIRDEGEARILEKQLTRGGRTQETVADLLAAALAELEARETPSRHRHAGDLCLQQGDVAAALEHYRRAADMVDGNDPGIDDCVTRALDLQFDDAIEKWREASRKTPAFREEAERRIGEIEALRSETLFNRFKERVKRFPLEMRYHFELGERYFEREQFDAALRHFQEASRNPKYHTRSLVFIGRCMAKKGIYDLAVERMEKALSTCSGRMDEERKDILHTLALVHLETGDREKALPLLKQIYAVDAGYMDVGRRIQMFYDPVS